MYRALGIPDAVHDKPRAARGKVDGMWPAPPPHSRSEKAREEAVGRLLQMVPELGSRGALDKLLTGETDVDVLVAQEESSQPVQPLLKAILAAVKAWVDDHPFEGLNQSR